MSEERLRRDDPEDADDDRADREPRIRVTKGSPWLIDAGRRAKWSTEAFLRGHAVDIRQVGDPVLHATAKKPRLPKKELEALIARMYASMVVARGVGIAAPQIGVPLRIAIMDVDEAGIVAIDPQVEWSSDELEETTEGCLSVRGLYGLLERPVRTRVAAADVNGKRFVIEGEELGAQCVLHETDHLDGTLYVDLMRSRADLRSVDEDDDRPVSGRSRAEVEEASKSA